MWDEKFVGLAEYIAQWSKDPSTKVGAVIADNNHRVVSLGYNGFPKGIKDTEERYADRATKYQLVCHAETNALLFANQPLDDLTLYVSHPPCTRCAVNIIQSGIAKVVTRIPTEDMLSRWGTDIEASKSLFDEVGIEYKEI